MDVYSFVSERQRLYNKKDLQVSPESSDVDGGYRGDSRMKEEEGALLLPHSGGDADFKVKLTTPSDSLLNFS